MVNLSNLLSIFSLLLAPAVATLGGYVYTEGTNFYIDGYKIYFSGTNTCKNYILNLYIYKKQK